MDRVVSPAPSSDDEFIAPHKKRHSEKRLIAELTLLRVPQLGPASYWALQENFGSTEKILDADLNTCRGAIRQISLDTLIEIQNNDSHPLVQQAEKEFNYLVDNKINLVVFDDERYPALLKATHRPPPVLFVQGNINNLFLPQLAIVGSRNPTPTGRDNAIHFSQQLSSMGFVITSGMALGVDAAAHQGALKNSADPSAGSTIAVMGTGIDKTYPRSHHRLREQILENGGTLVTEFSLGVGPQASHFPRRNRIISGMSLGALVVEAAIKSGSLITARYALQQNREVFAIPGSIHNPLSRGCHALLREGASLVESIDDLREPLQGLIEFKWRELSASANHQQTTKSVLPADQLNDIEKQVLDQLDYDQTHADLLEQRTGLAPGSLLSALMSLELKGLITQNGGAYQRSPKSPLKKL